MDEAAAVARAYERMMARTERQPDGCLIFTGATDGHGYANVRVGKRVMNGHRLAWIHRHGQPPAGLEVMHTCDRPPCLEDEHHRLGTHLENLLDCVAKGRARRNPRRGADSPTARLTAAQVAEIRALKGTMGQRAIARRFSISQAHVGRIHRGESWAPAPEPREGAAWAS